MLIGSLFCCSCLCTLRFFFFFFFRDADDLCFVGCAGPPLVVKFLSLFLFTSLGSVLRLEENRSGKMSTTRARDPLTANIEPPKRCCLGPLVQASKRAEICGRHSQTPTARQTLRAPCCLLFLGEPSRRAQGSKTWGVFEGKKKQKKKKNRRVGDGPAPRHYSFGEKTAASYSTGPFFFLNRRILLCFLPKTE